MNNVLSYWLTVMLILVLSSGCTNTMEEPKMINTCSSKKMISIIEKSYSFNDMVDNECVLPMSEEQTVRISVLNCTPNDIMPASFIMNSPLSGHIATNSSATGLVGKPLLIGPNLVKLHFSMSHPNCHYTNGTGKQHVLRITNSIDYEKVIPITQNYIFSDAISIMPSGCTVLSIELR